MALLYGDVALSSHLTFLNQDQGSANKSCFLKIPIIRSVWSVLFCVCFENKRDSYHLCLPLKRKTKIAADDILIFYFYLSKKNKA